MKIVMLTPCLMQDNNRKANKGAMRYALEHYGLDEYVVNDQCFQPTDYEDGFTYIGHHAEKQGFTNTRNQLLTWFYESDYDYALWMDANARVSRTSLNDFLTVAAALREGKIAPDAIMSTLGAYVSKARIDARKNPYHKSVVRLTGSSGCDWFHGMFLANLLKRYGISPLIDRRCDPRIGLSEDVYFARFIRQTVVTYQCPTIIVSKPSHKTSTWMAQENGYYYPKIDYDRLDSMIAENIQRYGLPIVQKQKRSIELARVEEFKDKVSSYKPQKRPKGGLI